MSLLCEKLKEVFDVAEVRPENVLREFSNWDSLAILSIVSLAEENYKVQLSADDIKNVQTVSELEAMIQARKAHG